MQFDHLALCVDDVSRTVNALARFSNRVSVEYADATWAMLDVEGRKLALVTRGDHPSHAALRVESIDELAALASKYMAEIKTHRDGSQYFYVSLKKGYALEFISYPY